MKRVANSKGPNVKQLSAMASNLQEKFGKPSAIEVDCWAHSPGRIFPRYYLYVEDKIHETKGSWRETLNRYREIIRS